jgi:hypothetical protein
MRNITNNYPITHQNSFAHHQNVQQQMLVQQTYPVAPPAEVVEVRNSYSRHHFSRYIRVEGEEITGTIGIEENLIRGDHLRWMLATEKRFGVTTKANNPLVNEIIRADRVDKLIQMHHSYG